MKTIEIDLNGKKAHGVEVSLPKAPLVLAHGAEGFVMCGYLNIEAAEKMGVAAALVRGVATVSDLLAASVETCTTAAAKKGVEKGMKGRDALARFV